MTPEQVAEMALYAYLFIKKSGGLWSSRLLFFADDFWDEFWSLWDAMEDHALWKKDRCEYNRNGYCHYWRWSEPVFGEGN
ncbi:hypothetical protein [Thermococcus celer]|uniref:Uncharacterized protein n=1 Tax=Thermococcus celer Vu 13 = JCM 8558 TaxID=1293037 RepID=A0A218P0D0_THECE|nr:hypothetical protein [Thermococcus celer]ASI98375.1 hypothetical protein A3L02_01740 [Thermococcus celer Vu 13 = JCM 8558]